MAKITATTQDHLDIAEIKNDMLILKNGGACVVLQANAINFDLLSAQEQDAAIAAYSSLLNALSFPIQVTIRSKKMDISEYLEKVREVENRQYNSKIKAQLKAYRHFIEEELVVRDEVLDKSFYVTIPYKIVSFTEATPLGWLDSLFGFQSKSKSRVNVDQIIKDASADLQPKKNFLMKEFSRIGIKTKALTTPDLIKLFYEIYNSETAQRQKMRGNIAEYTSALVEPKLI